MSLRKYSGLGVVLGGLAMVAIAWPLSARANVYATNLRLNNTTNDVVLPPGTNLAISYLLNEPATLGVTVNILSGPNSVRALTFSAGGAGALAGTNTVVWDGKDSLSNDLAGGAYTLNVTAASIGYTNWTQLTADTNAQNMLAFGTGIAVDRNAASPYYGRIFVANGVSDGGPFPGDVPGVLKLNADGSPAAEGLTGDMGHVWDGNFFSPWKIAVSPDDFVYINDFASNGEIFRWDPLLSTNSLLHVLDQSNHTNNDYLSGLALSGTGTNTQILTTEYFAQFGVLKFGLTTNGGVATNDPGAQIVGIGAGTNSLRATPLDVALDASGNLYVVQDLEAQSSDTYAYPRVFRFPAYNPATNNHAPELAADWAVGAGLDDYAGAYGVAVDPTGTYVAVAFRGFDSVGGHFSGNTKILYATNGVEVTSLDLGVTLNGTANHDDTDVAWDAVGNIYYIDNQPDQAEGVWRAFSPPGTNQATTVALQAVQVPALRITSISVSGGRVTVAFTPLPGDAPAAYQLFATPTLGTSFSPVGDATLTALSPGLFQATAPVDLTNAPTQFYRIGK